MDKTETFDVIVVGSGAAGLTAAFTAARAGAHVCVLERDALIGGTTALSGGWMWIPGNALARARGIADSAHEARSYLASETGSHFDAARVDAFLAHAPCMLEELMKEAGMDFLLGEFPEYHPGGSGSRSGCRSVCAMPFDARALGTSRRLLRPPLPELTLFGLPLMAGKDLLHFYNATRSLRSATYVIRRLARYGWDLMRHGANTQLMNGSALAARLLHAVLAAGVQVRPSSHVQALVQEHGSVVGVSLTDGRVLRAERGVILACGGFSHSMERRKKLFPHDRLRAQHRSPVPATVDGAGLALAQSVGGVLEDRLPNAAAWVPVSEVPRRDGGTGLFVHFVDRPKPGFIAVRSHGRRFVNEANSYHDFICALLAQDAADDAQAFLICDHHALRTYGLGVVKPAPFPIGRWLRNGYLLRADTWEALACQAGIDPAQLSDTVTRYNVHAAQGEDPEFGKGGNVYNRFLGDPTHMPNPNVAPLAQPPFYAVRVVPGDIGTYAGICTNARARVLRSDGNTVKGLYAVGNDMASIMGGGYPGPGITLGPGMTFGYIAARDAMGVAIG